MHMGVMRKFVIHDGRNVIRASQNPPITSPLLDPISGERMGNMNALLGKLCAWYEA